MKEQIPHGSAQVLAVIMARGGSVGLPGKALRMLCGKPVIAYTFDHVRESRLITRCVVSSDDPAILTAGANAGFETITRPAALATASSATDPVLRHAINVLYASSDPNGPLPAAVVMLYGNVPIRRSTLENGTPISMIDRCVDMLLKTGCDSVQTIASVGKMHPYWMFDLAADMKIKKHIPNDIFRRQDLPPLYGPTGAVYALRTEVLMAAEKSSDPHAFLGADRRALVVGPEDSVDIDTERDLWIAEAVLRTMRDQLPK